MSPEKRCELCGKLLGPAKSAVPAITTSLSALAIGCSAKGCTIPQRLGRAGLAAVVAYGLTAGLDYILRDVCGCDPTPAAS